MSSFGRMTQGGCDAKSRIAMEDNELVAVVLPDGSVELLDVDFKSVGGLLFEYPNHQLRAAQDPEQPVLPVSYRLKRGMTYFLYPSAECTPSPILSTKESHSSRHRSSTRSLARRSSSPSQSLRTPADRSLQRSQTEVLSTWSESSGQELLHSSSHLQNETSHCAYTPQDSCTVAYGHTRSASDAGFWVPGLVVPEPGLGLSDTPTPTSCRHRRIHSSWSGCTSASSPSVTPQSASFARAPHPSGKIGIHRSTSSVSLKETADHFFRSLMRQQSLPVAKEGRNSSKVIHNASSTAGSVSPTKPFPRLPHSGHSDAGLQGFWKCRPSKKAALARVFGCTMKLKSPKAVADPTGRSLNTCR